MFHFLKNLFLTVLLLVILLSAGYGYARYIEPNRLTEKEVTLQTELVSASDGSVTVALFADTHFSEYYDLNDFAKVVDSINEQNPDIVIFAGDLIDNFSTYEGDTNAISQALAQINAEYGKFAVFGNHDYGGGAARVYQEVMESGGFKVLINEYYPLDSLSIGIVGIDDYVLGGGRSETASWARPDYYNIAISHAPDVMDEVLDTNVDIMLSGHTHGRQINLPFFDDMVLPQMGKKYPKGMYAFENERNSALYVNSGLGTTKLPLRFMSPPEVTFLTIVKSQS